MRPSTKDIAWFAGLFEGEGSYGRYVYQRSPTDSWQSEKLTINMTDLDVLQRAQHIWYGWGSLKPRKLLPNRKQVWTLQFVARQARQIILTILPFLGKRRLAKIKAVVDTYRN